MANQFKGWKGPYKIGRYEKSTNGLADMLNIDSVNGIESLATVWCFNDKDERAIATAHLFAAAPDLLTALQDIVEHAQLNEVLYKQASAAIQKALNK